MRTPIRTILPLFILACAPLSVATAQTGFPGGITESPRPLTEETGFEEEAEFDVGAPRTTVTWLAGTGGRTGDDASVFSVLGGFVLQGAINAEGAIAYARNIPDGLDGINVLQGSVELGLFTARLDPLGVALAVSGEAQWVEDIAQGYSAGAALSKTFAERVEVGGRMAYSGSEPEAGASTWAWVPGITAAVFPLRNTSVRANYTFDNDLDGEDSYEFVAAHRLQLGGGPPFQIRAGINNNSDVSAGIIVILR